MLKKNVCFCNRHCFRFIVSVHSMVLHAETINLCMYYKITKTSLQFSSIAFVCFRIVYVEKIIHKTKEQKNLQTNIHKNHKKPWTNSLWKFRKSKLSGTFNVMRFCLCKTQINEKIFFYFIFLALVPNWLKPINFVVND